MTENEYFESEMGKDNGTPFASVGNIVEILISSAKELETGLVHKCEIGDWPNCVYESPLAEEGVKH
jgi:hypothetical protein